MSIDYPNPPAYLMGLPKKVLAGTARDIEAWLKTTGDSPWTRKQRPTLLDLEAARRARS